MRLSKEEVKKQTLIWQRLVSIDYAIHNLEKAVRATQNYLDQVCSGATIPNSAFYDAISKYKIEIAALIEQRDCLYKE